MRGYFRRWGQSCTSLSSPISGTRNTLSLKMTGTVSRQVHARGLPTSEYSLGLIYFLRLEFISYLIYIPMHGIYICLVFLNKIFGKIVNEVLLFIAANALIVVHTSQLTTLCTATHSGCSLCLIRCQSNESRVGVCVG